MSAAPLITVAAAPIAVPKPTAAAMLGMSVDTFDRCVRPHVRTLHVGRSNGRSNEKGRRLVLFLVEDLQRWARDQAVQLLTDEEAARL